MGVIRAERRVISLFRGSLMKFCFLFVGILGVGDESGCLTGGLAVYTSDFVVTTFTVTVTVSIFVANCNQGVVDAHVVNELRGRPR
jgi:hypothetical protein